MWAKILGFILPYVAKVKGIWIYVSIALAISAWIGYLHYKINSLEKEILLKENSIVNQTVSINTLKSNNAQCRVALYDSQTSVANLLNELKTANDRYLAFELDANQTKLHSEYLIKDMQQRINFLQKEVARKQKSAITDKQAFEIINKDINKAIDSIKAINILFED